ncbi:MAG: winged helix DNA-binding domain-containing protein [Nocardioidaceae bacterium]
MTRCIDVDERRARLAHRHRLLPAGRTDDLTVIADDLVALHSSDPVTVFLSAMLRMERPAVGIIEAALYDDRAVVRHYGMRRTLWVATPPVVRLMHAAATRKLIGPEHRRTAKLLAASGVKDPDGWLARARDHVRAALHEHGPMTARQLGERVPELRHKLQMAPGKSYAATVSAHTRVLQSLCFEGEVVRTRPTGTWVNGAYTYAAMDSWLPGGVGELKEDEAATELADRWLRRFGPATAKDLQWWMGWTVALTTRALRGCGAVEMALDDGPGWVAAGDDPEAPPAGPWVALLPSLDPTTMGWKERAWYLPDAAAEAFDRNGNAGPTIWVDGRVVGAWAQAADGEIRVHYFERVAAARRAEVDDRVEALRAMVGETRFTVRFPGLIQASLLA